MDFSFVNIEPPEEYREIIVGGEEREGFQCQVCLSPHREAIETICFSGLSMKAAKEYIEKNIGLKISVHSLRRHITNHFSDVRSLKFHALCASMGEIPEDMPLATAEGLLVLMLSDAMKKVFTGEIEPRDFSDVEKVIKLQQSLNKFTHDKNMDERRLEADEQGGMNAADAMRQLGYIMLALRETVPPEILERAVTRAWSLGLNMDYKDITEVPIYQSDYVETDMSLAVSDAKALGRKRTREELVEAEWEPVVGEDVPPED